LLKRISVQQARRIAIEAASLGRARPRRVHAGDLARVIRRLGLLQLDFVNVLIPAHYLVLFSRLGAYDRALFDEVAYQSREFTEQWAHEASLIPVETWPLLRHRMERHRARPYTFADYLRDNPDHAEWAIEQVRERGPLTAAGLARGESVSLQHSWYGTVERALLEAFFGRGILAVTARSSNFVRSYDLAERVIPPVERTRAVGQAEAARELVRIAARAYGIATAADLADYFRMTKGDVSPAIADLTASGELLKVEVEGWPGEAFLHRDTARPRVIHTSTLLSPFDPLIWYRPRVKRIFDLDYRLEIFLPESRRKWGYYVLPFLQGDRLTARVDLRADRGNRRLEVVAAYREAEADGEMVAPALAGELRTLAAWLGLEQVRIGAKGNLARQLRRAS